MGKAQEGAWLLAMSLSYPRQALPNICVQWPSRGRDAFANAPSARYDFPAIPYRLASIGRFHQCCWLIVVGGDAFIEVRVHAGRIYNAHDVLLSRQLSARGPYNLADYGEAPILRPSCLTGCNRFRCSPL